MDIQGFEHKALLGMRNILKTNHNIKVLMEFWPYGLTKAGTGPRRFSYLSTNWISKPSL